MKYLIILSAALFLSGCSSTKFLAAKPEFPSPYIDAKTKQMPKCEDLKQIPAGTNNLSEVFKLIVDNYTLYYQCSNKVDGWAEWYERVKKEYDKKD
jgi:PBP1b-binding outer membrane lipoprotein LpoB